MENFFSNIFVPIGIGLASIFGWTAPVQIPVSSPTLGASFSTPDVRALFTTTLASRITASDTSMTLTSATDSDGNTLASSTYGFIIDEGTSVEEFVLADCTGTVCTNMTRGLSVSTGTTTVSALRFEHRRGASVKITDAPSLVFLINVLKGRQNLENPIRYNSHPTFTLDTQLIDKKYADDLAFSGAGVIDASATARGVVELATTLETASSTAAGTSGNLAIPASNATSTYNSATAPLRVVVTQNNGKIDSNFISTTTLFSPGVDFTVTTTTVNNNLVIDPTKVSDTYGFNPMWTLIASSSLSSDAATTTVTIPPRRMLKIFASGNVSGNGGGLLRFNGDARPDYSYGTASSTAYIPATLGATSIPLGGRGGEMSAIIDIFNATSTFKTVTASVVEYQSQTAATTTYPYIYPIGAIWATSTPQQISSISISKPTGGTNILAGFTIYVYGSSF